MKLQVVNRKTHYWLAIFVALPLMVIAGSGILLQLKKQLPWVQPAERAGVGGAPALSLAQVVEICSQVPEAQVRTWEDIQRVDVRPAKGMLKVWAKSGWEIQLDTATGELLQVAYRRSDLIEAIHDGSFFHRWVKLGIFLPAGVVLLLLWLTGLYLFFLPILRRRRAAR